MELEEFRIYQLSMALGEQVWKIVKPWGYFEKDTVGKQLVRAVDSIGANISEGYGRYHFKEVKNFSYYSRGSLYEVKTWLIKASNRGLVKEKEYDQLMNDINHLAKLLNAYIKSIGKYQ